MRAAQGEPRKDPWEPHKESEQWSCNHLCLYDSTRLLYSHVGRITVLTAHVRSRSLTSGP